MNCKTCSIDKTMYRYLLKNLWKDHPEILEFVKENIHKSIQEEKKKEKE